MMSDQSLDALAKALVEDPPRAVDPDALAAADRDELAAALRRAVAEFPATEQRTRLAAAFRAMSIPAPGAVADVPASPVLAAKPDTPISSTSSRSLISMRSFNLARAGVLAGVLVVSVLAGVLVGAITQESQDGNTVVPAAAQNPVPVLEPIATGDEPPSDDFIAGLLPPDPQAQAEIRADAMENRADELGDEADLDPEDVYVPEITDAQLAVSGYVDALSGGADALPSQGDIVPVDEGEPNREGADGTEPPDGDGDSSDGGAAPVPAGDGEDSDAPGLVDLCAGDDAPEGCDGIAGTVTLATVEAFRFNFDPEVVTYWPACVGRRDLAPDEFLIVVMTNNLGSFTARYRVAGTDTAFTEVTGESPEIWRDALDEGSVAQVVTCLLADRPDNPDALRLEVDITGDGAQDSGTAHFAGIIDLAAAPEPEPVPESRAGRPPVRVRVLTSSTLQVIVPAKDEEVVEVTLADRRPDGSGTCDRPVVEADRVATARRTDGIELVSDWENQVFQVSAPEPGPYVVCVDWKDDFDPPRHLESATIPVDVDGIAGAEVLLARYDHSPCMGGGCPSHPLYVGVSADVGDRVCTGDLREGGMQPATPQVMCTLDDVPSRVDLYANGGFSRTSGGIRLDGVVSHYAVLVGDACRDTACTRWYTVPVRAPGGLLEGNGGIVGQALVGVRVTGGGPESVTIGDERPEFTDGEEISGPRLRWNQVSAEPDPANPARDAVIRWATDVPADVAITLTPAEDTDACARPRPVETDREANSVRVRSLCPGIRYYVNFDLRADDGSRTIYNLMRPPFHLSPSVGVVQRSAVVDMEALTAQVDYELEFAEVYEGSRAPDRPDSTRGVVPTRMSLSFGRQRVVDYSQYFDGHAYFGLDCAVPPHFDRSGTTASMEIRGGTVNPSDSYFAFHHYDSYHNNFAGCPGTRQQWQRRLGPFTCGMVVPNLELVGGSNKVNQLLGGTEAVYRGTSPRCGGYFEVTLTVRVREVRTLRGS